MPSKKNTSDNLLNSLSNAIHAEQGQGSISKVPEKGTAKANPETTINSRQEKKSKTTSVSWYEEDKKEADLLREILQNRFGGSYSNSLIIRIALHTASKDPQKLKEALDKVTARDGRKDR